MARVKLHGIMSLVGDGIVMQEASRATYVVMTLGMHGVGSTYKFYSIFSNRRVKRR